MSKRITSGAVQLDADVCNTLVPPVSGCHAGVGLHVVIPPDWQARILAGQQVPGCTYHTVELDTLGVTGVLAVSDFAIAQLGIPGIVAALPVPLKAQAALLNAKLLVAQVVPG